MVNVFMIIVSSNHAATLTYVNPKRIRRIV